MLVIFFLFHREAEAVQFLTFLPELAEVLQVQIYIILFKTSKQLKKNFFNYCKIPVEPLFLDFFSMFFVSYCTTIASLFVNVLLGYLGFVAHLSCKILLYLTFCFCAYFGPFSAVFLELYCLLVCENSLFVQKNVY